MALTTVDIAQITGTAKSVVQLLSNTRYGLDFYQREYSWEEAQVGELIDDLTMRFLDEYDPVHEREHVASYRPYFLGPIVTAQKDGTRYLVDGQQRLTTMTLLLIYLRSVLLAEQPEEAAALQSLVYTSAYGKVSFNLDVDERREALEAILDGRDFDTSGQPDSVRHLWERYQGITQQFPTDSLGDALPNFIDWLLHRVILVEIVAPDQEMALEIFETMNDRGLRLTNTDMLKSFLLARVGDESVIRDLNERWRNKVTELSDIEKNADSEFVKAWLRGDFAETQRERKKNAAPGDFDIIGTAFHKWVRDNAERIGLVRASDFRAFVEHDFLKLASRYAELLRASEKFTPGLEAVFYNARTGFTMQLPVILAAITPDDDDQQFREKAGLVAGALEIFVARRMVNYRNFGYSTVSYTMFNLMKKVRNRPVDELKTELRSWLDSEPEGFDALDSYSLTQRNRKHIHYLLARMTSWMDDRLGQKKRFTEYIDRSRSRPYEVEHIWADKFERHADEFESKAEFNAQRNKFGDLLLLPKDFNASYGAMPYSEKVAHYLAHNPLAKSLHPTCYENNPTFLRLISDGNLAFEAYPEQFTKADIDARQKLYRQLAEQVWSPESIGL